ncbi:MAG: cyclic nucleotide-binding domain-containing protein [Oligoflexia bacterium]|nr:cyclic nucleotide-binding domain-containing protein [Oligoflexia bacterium]MBF0366082.1 cyclic nucleotide-binding domain-containing protein [Oligoflexia bacterium]
MTDTQSTIILKKDQILFREGAKDSYLYLIQSGKILIFVNKRTEIIPLAYLGPGEFLGELSFFDKNPRSANVIAVEESSLVRIPFAEANKLMPPWMTLVSKFLISRIRLLDQIIKEKGIKKKNAETIAPLNISEQTRIFRILKQDQES